MNITINISSDDAMELINKIESISIVTKKCEQEKKKHDSLDNKFIRNNIKGGVYTKLFKKSNPYWNDDPDYNRLLFESQMQYLNDQLRVNEFLHLNDAYNALGFKAIKGGYNIGWVKGSHVEFDIKEVNIENEYGNSELAYLIDFNIDGYLY